MPLWPSGRKFLRLRACLPFLLCLAFLLSQSIVLAHDHINKAEAAYDCELCLKLNSGDGIPVQHSLPQIPVADNYLAPAGAASPLLVIRSANARAPPFSLI